MIIMARHIIHQLVDDIDGTILNSGEGETVAFSIDGRSYEIDLKLEHVERLSEALAPYIAAARQTSAPMARRKNQRRNVDEIRTWARANGFTVSDRGRIPAEVQRAFQSR
jgi:hypothetical protein